MKSLRIAMQSFLSFFELATHDERLVKESIILEIKCEKLQSFIKMSIEQVSPLIFSHFLLLGIYGCTQSAGKDIAIEPEHFKIKISYEVHTRGILIDTYWGTDKIKHTLLWDNHSPTWVNESVIEGNKSISKLKGFSYNTTTADGQPITGDVYICDRILLG